ncbi:Glu/Leu/Phe/Val dehydrogenase dimerization domain-containing protein [Spongisporangium articulatum]|uniref:Glu/Leu/Phe/Val dehydrogenase dimerization domain-containing protein n=1 Tax=Spongisporangium articulatum TaxID=3362603 RepID=A0ABW8AHA6_9ACTN
MGDPWEQGHEQVVFCRDRASGLMAVIAVYDTRLGPALGGTRFRAYPSKDAALQDALNLSRAMAYKNALAGLDHGGGKGVILGDPVTVRSEPLIRAYGRFVESLHGRYVTACDVGTVVADMDLIGRETRYATGRSPAEGGAGDSGVLTAFGVFQGLRAAAQVRWGAPEALAGRLVGVSGVGKVGRALVPLLLDAGARVVATDPAPAAVGAVAGLAGVRVVEDTAALLREPLDVYAPCALGAALTAEVVEGLSAQIVCGGANNQLATPEIGDLLHARDVLYCPDFCVNAGGVIAVADEWAGRDRGGYDAERARGRAARIFDTTLAVLTEATETGVTPDTAAARTAERRMAEVGGLTRIFTGLP